LAFLPCRILRDLGGLNAQFAFEQLGLRAHRDVLPGSHRAGTGEQTGDARQAHYARLGHGARKAEDQRHVADQPVAHAKDRSTRPAALHVPTPRLPIGTVEGSLPAREHLLYQTFAAGRLASRRSGVERAVGAWRRVFRVLGGVIHRALLVRSVADSGVWRSALLESRSQRSP
jgi:hypothetical protein